MAASYPNSIVALANHTDISDTIFASDINTPNAEIVAVETGLLNGVQHNLSPLNDNAKDLGDASHTWRNVFLKGTFNMKGVAYTWPGADGSANQVLTTNGSATLSWAPPGQLTLLKSGSGTTTNGVGEIPDSVAITGLTLLDTLVIHVSIESVAQTTGNPRLGNLTDGVDLNLWTSGSLAAGAGFAIDNQIRCSKGALTKIFHATNGATGTVFGTATFTQNWTGSWTLALRHDGVTAGGTFKWSWAVFKLAGQ